MSPNKDKTGNDRQRRRREREKTWLKEQGFESWEALHTSLMNGETSLTKRAADVRKDGRKKVSSKSKVMVSPARG